jgi:probable F420-dependent oxidoreductase
MVGTKNMLVETNLRNLSIDEVQESARTAEELGLDVVCQAEITRDPFMLLTMASLATQRVRLATSVLIAFPRSPMVTAYASRTLHDLSGGRFELGLGTQVRGHIQRRFSSHWSSPGPQLREYVASLQAIFNTWQTGEPLDFQGDYYSFTLMTPEFNPGPSPLDPIKIQVAAVNPYNIKLAGELADSLRVHSFTTPSYISNVIWPYVREGASKNGRSLDGFEVIGGGFIATGATEEVVHQTREWARRRVAFYGSTRAYRPVLEHHGWPELGDKLRQLVKEERWDDLAPCISDDVLDVFCVAGTYDQIGKLAAERYAGVVNRISFPYPEDAATQPDAFRQAIRDLQAIPTADPQQA